MNNYSKKKLYYFTENFPYEPSYQWKKHELEIFKKYFQKITVIPLRGNNKEVSNVVDGIDYEDPIIKDKHFSGDKSLVKKLLVILKISTPYFLYNLLIEIFINKVYFSKTKIKKLVLFCYELGLFKSHLTYMNLFADSSRDNAVFYYYWGIGQINAVIFMDPNILPVICCRFHGWDLYSERHKANYIPFQQILLKKIDLALPCSDNGRDYLTNKFPFVKNKIITSRLGTLSKGRNQYTSDGILKLITCSHVVEIKRLDILCKALLEIGIPVSWTHIGDGPLMPEIKEYAEKFQPNLVCQLMGFVDSQNVLDVYRKNSFDLFINVSESEGVPVSIMEAFSAGIPVYATDVGGSSEIVNESVGKLLPANVSPKLLATFLEEFHYLSDKEKITMRDNAFIRYEEKCNAYNNAEKLAELLANL